MKCVKAHTYVSLSHFLSFLLYIFFNTVLILAGADVTVNGPNCFNLGVSYVC